MHLIEGGNTANLFPKPTETIVGENICFQKNRQTDRQIE